jgi:galactose mutarotase-like enzyme
MSSVSTNSSVVKPPQTFAGYDVAVARTLNEQVRPQWDNDQHVKDLNASQDWQKVGLGFLVNKGMAEKISVNAKTDPKISRDQEAKALEVYKFKTADGKLDMSIAENLGANVLDLNFDGMQIITSPIITETFSGKHSASGYGGMPFISPPNRIANNTIYDENGKPISLKASAATFRTDDNGNIIHGKLFKLPWKLDTDSVQYKGSTGGIKLSFSFDTQKDTSLFARFGWGKYTLTYTLERDPETQAPKLITDMKFKNLSETKTYPLIGWGLHPYLVKDSDSQFMVNAEEFFQLDERKIPTGIHILGHDEHELDLRSARPATYMEGELDHTYAGLHEETSLKSTSNPGDKDFSGNYCDAAYLKRGDKLLRIRQSSNMPYITVCNQKDSICIEPQSAQTNASDPSIEINKIYKATYVKPGETEQSRVVFSLENAA